MDILSLFLSSKKFLACLMVAIICISSLPSNSSVLSHAFIIDASAQEDSSTENGAAEPEQPQEVNCDEDTENPVDTDGDGINDHCEPKGSTRS